MAKVNTRTLTATREHPPKKMRGLGVETLRNLQSVVDIEQLTLHDHVDIEYWPLTPVGQELQSHEKFGDEILTPDPSDKTTKVTYEIVNKTAEELEAEAEAAAEVQRLEDLETEIAGDSVIHNLKAMTNAEYNAWWDANVTTAADARGVLKKLVRVVIRRIV